MSACFNFSKSAFTNVLSNHIMADASRSWNLFLVIALSLSLDLCSILISNNLVLVVIWSYSSCVLRLVCQAVHSLLFWGGNLICHEASIHLLLIWCFWGSLFSHCLMHHAVIVWLGRLTKSCKRIFECIRLDFGVLWIWMCLVLLLLGIHID